MTLISYSSIPQTDPLRSPQEILPTMYDLPSEDPEEPGLPDDFHDLQPQLLSRSLVFDGYRASPLGKAQAEAQLAQAARNLVATSIDITQVTTLLGLSGVQMQDLYEDDARA